MGSGYNILWTNHTLTELASTYEYLEIHFTEKELKKLSTELDLVLKLISKKPNLFPESESKGIKKAVIKRFNTIYYRVHLNSIEILSFFSNRQSPDKRKL